MFKYRANIKTDTNIEDTVYLPFLSALKMSITITDICAKKVEKEWPGK